MRKKPLHLVITLISAASAALCLLANRPIAADASSTGTVFAVVSGGHQVAALDPVTGGRTVIADFTVPYPSEVKLPALVSDSAGHRLFSQRIAWASVNPLTVATLQLVTIDTQTHASTVAPILEDQMTLGWDPASGTLFGATSNAPWEVFKVDPTTGAETPFAALPGPVSSSLAAVPALHLIYMAIIDNSTVPGSPRLVSVDTLTGTVSPGPVLNASPRTLVYDVSSGLFFANTCCPHRIVRVDATTGATTTLIDPANPYIAFDSLTVDPNSHTLYSIETDSTAFPIQYVMSISESGSFTLSGQIPLNLGYITGLAFEPPAVSLSTQQLSFGLVPVGQQSEPQQVTLTNTGGLALNVSSITAASPFVVIGDTCTGAVVAPSAACSVSVAFAPTTRGTFSVPLVITDDAHDSPQQVTLTGQAVVRQLSVLPASLALGGQPVGSADISTQQMVTVTNTGADPVDLGAFAVSPGFAIGSQTCSVGVLAPAASCTIGVYAAPSAVGPETGQLTISDNATGAPQAVALSAVGLGGLASLSTTSVDFGSVRVNSKSAPVTITLTNTGNIAVKVSRATLSGPNKGEYTITSETCQNQTVEPGASCQVVIIFRPESTGARTATLTLTDSALNSPQTVSLSGTGVSR